MSPARWDGPERRHWLSQKLRKTDVPNVRIFEKNALRRVRELAAALADVTNAYEGMNGDELGGRNIAAVATLTAMRALADRLTDAVRDLDGPHR